ncbi:MAG TPA: biotin transporter BioY [Candidatus Ozemobacteraceae bacterium]|nr:biotin transporter BioY [Candidatus Ozemobacteraceae bacterium]
MSHCIVLADRLAPRIGIKSDPALIVAGAILIALCSGIEIPLQPVPITGQTFGVLFAAAFLGARRGAGAAALFVFAGSAGIPLFSGGACGVSHLFGPTGGYLAGFIAAALVVGSLSRKGFDRSIPGTVFSMAVGNSIIYIFGVIWLSRFVGWEHAFTGGVLPFLAGDALKIILASSLLPAGWSRLNDR